MWLLTSRVPHIRQLFFVALDPTGRMTWTASRDLAHGFSSRAEAEAAGEGLDIGSELRVVPARGLVSV